MKILFLVLGIIYLSVAVLAFIIQALTKVFMGNDTDQSEPMKWKKIFKYSFQWPYILIKLVVR